jgi:hypothetical protein
MVDSQKKNLNSWVRPFFQLESENDWTQHTHPTAYQFPVFFVSCLASCGLPHTRTSSQRTLALPAPALRPHAAPACEPTLVPRRASLELIIPRTIPVLVTPRRPTPRPEIHICLSVSLALRTVRGSTCHTCACAHCAAARVTRVQWVYSSTQ